jgi:hypothetical protein
LFNHIQGPTSVSRVVNREGNRVVVSDLHFVRRAPLNLSAAAVAVKEVSCGLRTEQDDDPWAKDEQLHSKPVCAIFYLTRRGAAVAFTAGCAARISLHSI